MSRTFQWHNDNRYAGARHAGENSSERWIERGDEAILNGEKTGSQSSGHGGEPTCAGIVRSIRRIERGKRRGCVEIVRGRESVVTQEL